MAEDRHAAASAEGGQPWLNQYYSSAPSGKKSQHSIHKHHNQKWKTRKENMKVGGIVMLVDDNLLRSQWRK